MNNEKIVKMNTEDFDQYMTREVIANIENAACYEIVHESTDNFLSVVERFHFPDEMTCHPTYEVLDAEDFLYKHCDHYILDKVFKTSDN